jgi:Pyridoxamine 5'-phosphate oxidase
VYETPDELDRLQQLLDESAARAGVHLKEIFTPDRRLTARGLCDELLGLRLIVVATVTSDGRPLCGPVDGFFIHGSFWFSSARDSVRMRHLRARPAITASHVPGEKFAVTVHGRARLFDLSDPSHAELRQAMLHHYLPLQGPVFEEWLDSIDGLGARIDANRMFTYRNGD